MTAEQERQSASLMRLAQAGDQIAYASLLVLLTSATRQFARTRLGAVPWIDDVVQETLLAVHRARQTYDPGRPFAPWFYAVASSRLIDVNSTSSDAYATWSPLCASRMRPADRCSCSEVTGWNRALKVLRTPRATGYSEALRGSIRGVT